ncbi:MAG: nucleotidyltransferase domain-containing protein [Chloroflexi bacterium]|nr:MAG: nucleotidyltransferase domain-containing protein [Chloroflexota bacterium]
MRRPFSGSVRTFWLDRSAVLDELTRFARSLVEHFDEVERVILFGSMARGDAVPGSDADLLLILRESALPFLERTVRYRLGGLSIGVDLFPYTRQEMDRLLDEGHPFLRQALREGVELARREDG